jgi:hypothetical protein
MAKRAKPTKMRDFWKPWGGVDADPYYAMEFTHEEDQLVYAAIKERTGLDYVRDHLMQNSMLEFSKAHGVPYSQTFGHDALVYCCIQLGIDPRQFPHNTPKLPIDDFKDAAKARFGDLESARNEIQRSVQRSKLYDFWIQWFDHKCENGGCDLSYHGTCREVYEQPNLELLAEAIVAFNRKRARRVGTAKPPKLRLIHSCG